MKKVLLSLLLIIALLSTCITAFALIQGSGSSETVVFDASTYTTESLLDSTTGLTYFHDFGETREGYATTATVIDYPPTDKLVKIAFKNGGVGNQYMHIDWRPTINLVGSQYLAIRMINDSVAKTIMPITMQGMLADSIRLLYKDGTVTCTQNVGAAYCHIIPANFDGWFLLDLTIGTFNGRTLNADGTGGTFKRTVDTATVDAYVAGVSTPLNFAQLGQTVFYLGEYANGAVSNFSSDTNLYIGDVKLMDLELNHTGSKVPPANLNAVIVNSFDTFTESSVNSSNFYSASADGINVSVVNDNGDASIKIANANENTAIPFTLGLLNCGSFSVLNGGANPYAFTMYVKTGATPVTIVQIFNNQTTLNEKAWVYNMNGEEVANSGETKTVAIPANFEGYYVGTMGSTMDWSRVGFNFAWWQAGGELTVDNFGFVTSAITPVTTAPPTTAPTTEAPTTEAPTTEAPTTEAPTTEAPTTEAPTTEAPTTEAPTTEAPTTEAPTTEAPTTEAPETTAPEEEGNPDTGAPLMIGAIITAVSSAAYVLRRKKIS